MPINTRSELTVDIEASIAKAYISELPSRELKEIRDHLSFILPKLKDPNSLIEPIKQALSAMDSRKKWFEKPLGILLIGIIVTIISGGIIFKLGWN